jgi:hypothetical protein
MFSKRRSPLSKAISSTTSQSNFLSCEFKVYPIEEIPKSDWTEHLVQPRLWLVSFQVSSSAFTDAVHSSASGLIPPAAIIAVPIAAGLIFAAWVYKTYLTTYKHFLSSRDGC